MMDISNNNWLAMSDANLVEIIGVFIKHHRLLQNKTQQQVADDAGINRSTLSQLEKGQKITLQSLIQVLRVLDLLYIMEAFKVQVQISPLLLAKLDQKKRKRASNTNKSNDTQSSW